MLTKPPHGSPCNGCGGCCIDQRCPLAAKLFGPGARCPALEPAFPAFTCGLVAHPERYAPDVVARHGAEAARDAALMLTGAGLGCDALKPGERPNEAWRAATIAAFDRAKTDQARRIWGV